MLSSDGKRWIWADEFGVTRMSIGRQLKLKNTIKVSSAHNHVSISPDGKLALVNGRVQTGVYGNDEATLVNLPGLGIRHKLSHFRGPTGLLIDDNGDPMVVTVAADHLAMRVVVDGDLGQTSRVPFADAPRTLTATVGPTLPEQTSLRTALAINNNGTFAALHSGVVWHGNARTGAIHWSLALTCHPSVDVALAVVNDAVWVTVMDHAADRARLLHITHTGEQTLTELAALAPPAISADFLLYQPASHTVTRRTLADSKEQTWDVRGHNTHPHAAPGAESWHGPRPPMTDRLPGQVSLAGSRALFIPWHAENVVELTAGTVLERKLLDAAGPYRRMMREIVTTHNAHLARIQVRAGLSYFDTVTKRRSCPMGAYFPPTPRVFINQLASQYAGNLTNRYPLRAHSWSWGGFSGIGYPDAEDPVPVSDMHTTLAWLKSAGLRPLNFDDAVMRHYKDRMGLPFSENLDKPALLTEGAERMWIRACLETIRHNGWPEGDIPTAWATEPVTTELACTALSELPKWTGPRFYHAIEMFSVLLAHHLRAAAAPILVHLITAVKPIFNWQQMRDAGQALVWIAKRHPEVAEPAIATISATHHDDVQSWAYESGLVVDALKQKKRHLGSNG